MERRNYIRPSTTYVKYKPYYITYSPQKVDYGVFIYFKFYSKKSVSTTIVLCQAHFHTQFIWY
jgi:hypothetical protein